MSNYRFIEVDPVSNRVSVDYLDNNYARMQIPRSNGAWLTGPDLDRYIMSNHPNPSTSGVLSSADLEFAQSVISEEMPQSQPSHIVDSVIQYLQGQFMDMVNKNKFPGGPWIFTEEGSHVWTVPPDLPWVRIAIFSSGRPTWEEGPGIFWGGGCAVPVGESVSISIGTETTVSSSLGSLTVHSGWSAAKQLPKEHYHCMPWGHVGRSGAVIIY